MGKEPLEHMETTDLQEPMLFAHVSGRSKGNFSKRSRQFVSLKGQALALED